MKPINDCQERLLNADELARILGVPISWIYERCRKGSSVVPIPSLRIGRYVRFHLPAVMQWLQDTKGLEKNRKM